MKKMIEIPHRAIILNLLLSLLFLLVWGLFSISASNYSDLSILIAELYWRLASLASVLLPISSLSVDDILINYDTFWIISTYKVNLYLDQFKSFIDRMGLVMESWLSYFCNIFLCDPWISRKNRGEDKRIII